MADCQITCIRKPDVSSKHEHITHVGNTAGNWMWRREDVIKSLDERTNTFYVLDPNTRKRADVGVRRPNDGRDPFLQTYSDGDWNNNLLSLKQCPISLG